MTRARSLKVLTEEGLIPRRGASCRLCLRILTFYAFNKGQMEMVLSSQPDWRAIADFFCLYCGFEKGLYKPRDSFEQFFGLAGGLPKSRMKTCCYSCNEFATLDDVCRFCKACQSCCRVAIVISKQGSVGPNHLYGHCNHRSILSANGRTASEHVTIFLRYYDAWPNLLREHLGKIISYLDFASITALQNSCCYFRDKISRMKARTAKQIPS